MLYYERLLASRRKAPAEDLMPTDHRAALARIKTFPQLIAYLRDEMGWLTAIKRCQWSG